MGTLREGMLRLMLLLAPAAAYALGAALWLGGSPAAYREFVNWLAITAYPVPQGDAWAVVKGIECARTGVDVFAAGNGCMDFIYSPLWLKLALPGLDSARFLWVGIAINAVFLLSLLLLPTVRERTGRWAMVAATASSAVLFGMERANVDLLLFALVSLAGWLLLRGWTGRLAGYGLVLLGGLLKYYPVAALALALREPWRRCFGVAAVAAALMAGFVGLYWQDVARSLAHVPAGAPLGSMFGSVTIGLAVVDEAHLAPVWINAIHLPMAAIAVFLAVRRGLASSTRAALNALGEGERMFLLIGSSLIVFCFFVSQNIAYRAIFLVMAMPGLLALRRIAPGRAFAAAPWWVLIVLWHPLWRNRLVWAAHQLLGATGRDAMRYLVCLAREWIWWSLIVVLLGYLVAFAVQSAAWGGLIGAIGRARGIAKPGATA